MSEREVVETRERILVSGDHLYVLLLVLILSLRKLWGFLLYGFLEENYLCLLCFIVVHVILSVNDPKIIILA